MEQIFCQDSEYVKCLKVRYKLFYWNITALAWLDLKSSSDLNCETVWDQYDFTILILAHSLLLNIHTLLRLLYHMLGFDS